MTKEEKRNVLTLIQSGAAMIKNIFPAKYAAFYPGKPFPKPIWLIDGRAVKPGLFFSKLLNDDSVFITVENINKNDKQAG